MYYEYNAYIINMKLKKRIRIKKNFVFFLLALLVKNSLTQTIKHGSLKRKIET